MQGTKHLTTEQLEQIRELHLAGRNTQQTAERIGCTVHQVRHALKRLGCKPAWSRNGVCYQRADEVRQWAKEGVSLSEIARRIGTTHHRVSQFLGRHGIERTPFRQVGENNPAWKGGRQIDKAGYVLVLRPDHPAANRHGYVREHRLVMEQMLGRPLEPTEVVHHKDNDPQNNDPANLELFRSNRDHLAETLDGRRPNWTREGMAKIRERWNRLSDERRGANRPRRKAPNDQPLPGMNDQTPG